MCVLGFQSVAKIIHLLKKAKMLEKSHLHKDIHKTANSH